MWDPIAYVRLTYLAPLLTHRDIAHKGDGLT